MEVIKRAIIVAAGEGSRLRPVSLTTPKPLVKVNGTRLIDSEINALKKNGINEIIIVAGYKKELLHEVYKDDPEILVIDNPYYLRGNNITSIYVARDYLPGSFVLEGDLMVYNDRILDNRIEKSGYLATWQHEVPEWELKVIDNTIQSCNISGGGRDNYRLWGISMWTEEDGARLSELVRRQFEDAGDWSIYWDEIALFKYSDQFDLGIREIKIGDIIEIDSFKELVAIDPSYSSYVQEGK